MSPEQLFQFQCPWNILPLNDLQYVFEWYRNPSNDKMATFGKRCWNSFRSLLALSLVLVQSWAVYGRLVHEVKFLTSPHLTRIFATLPHEASRILKGICVRNLIKNNVFSKGSIVECDNLFIVHYSVNIIRSPCPTTGAWEHLFPRHLRVQHHPETLILRNFSCICWSIGGTS